MTATQMTTEKVILKNLLKLSDYNKKVIPFLQEDYFTDPSERLLFQTIKNFTLKYNAAPDIDSLKIEIDGSAATEDQEKKILGIIEEICTDSPAPNNDWLIKTTEEFCQEKAVYNAMMKCIDIMSNKNKLLQKGSIPSLLSEALAVSFDPYVGHDYMEDTNDRFDYYHRVLEKIPFDLDLLNKITKGGLPRKTLNIILAGTGVGKSLFMCHLAASCLMQGKNVLYITLELAEHEVAKRIDANLMDIAIDNLMVLSRDMYDKKMEKLKAKSNGKLIIKEYPTTGAGAAHFKALLNELALKKSFKPDIIFVDYLNICASCRIKPGGAGMYEYVKSISEELRGLAVEFNLPIVSATQTNRTGFASSDLELTDTSESFGLPQTADFMIGLISTDDLKKRGQVMVKQLKNRYGDQSIDERFFLGIDRSKMKLYNVEDSAQKVAGNNTTPVASTTKSSKFSSIKV